MKILLLAVFLSLNAHAEAPPHGSFDRAQLFGMYQFETCTNSGSTIWEGEHQRQYIVVSHDPFDTRSMPADYMAAALFHTPYNPLVPIWELADLDKGWVKVIDEKTGVVKNAHENYTTATGVYSRLEWNYGEDGGWATFTLSKADDTHLAYEMERQDNLSGNHRQESCRLVKVNQ